MLSITDVRNWARNWGASVFVGKEVVSRGVAGVIKRYLSSDAKVIAISKNNDNDNNEQGQDYAKYVKRFAK